MMTELQSSVSSDIYDVYLVSFLDNFDSIVPQTCGTVKLVICGLSNSVIDDTILEQLSDSIAWAFHAASGSVTSRKRDTSDICQSKDKSSDMVAVEITAEVSSSDVICSGVRNVIENGYSTVLGGQNNLARGNYSIIHAGLSNKLFGDYSVIAGGFENSVSGDYSDIGGGSCNIVQSNYASVQGGSSNFVISNYGAVLGGYRNAVRGRHAVVVGGSQNTASGLYSVAMGQMTVASHDKSLVMGFAGKEAGICESQKDNSINFCANSVWINNYNLGSSVDFVSKRRLVSETVNKLKSEALLLLKEIEQQEELLLSLELNYPIT
jgi:hypothetical protein